MFIATLFNLLLNETNCYLISIDATLVKDPGEGGGESHFKFQQTGGVNCYGLFFGHC